jgi:hypothetical protein
VRHRSDSNQREIIKALQSCGAFVVNLNQVGEGCPDLAVYLHGWHLVEVKTNSPIGWKYKPAQKKFNARCPVKIPVLTTTEEAATWANVVTREAISRKDVSYAEEAPFG